MSDTFALLPLLRRWWWALLLGALLAAAAAYFASTHSSPEYRGEAKFIVGPINAGSDELGAAGSLARTYSELAVDRPVLRDAIREVGARLTVRELRENLAVRANDISRILTIEVLNGDAQTAAALANAIGARLQDLSEAETAQNAKRIGQFASAAAVDSLPRVQRALILDAARQLLGQSTAGRLTVVQAAEPEGQADRDTLFVVIIAMLAGAVVAAIIVLFRESAARGVESEASLEALSGVKHLGRVDAHRDRSWRRALPAWTAPSSPRAERYRLLTFKLGFLDTQESPGSLVLVDPKDGLTAGIVAGNLAACISQAGWRVVLVDANTTSDGLTYTLRLEGVRGYTNLLADRGTRELPSYLKRLDLDNQNPLLVLPRGNRTVAAIDQVEHVRRLLERLEYFADVVLISAPPPHRVPAGLMWARVARRTLLVLDAERTSGDDVRDALQSLAAVDASVTGTAFAQRSPVAEFLGGLRGRSSAPPRRGVGREKPREPIEPSGGAVWRD